MRLRSHIISLCILGAILPQLVTSFDVRRRREVSDAPENYKYFLQPFVVPEAESVPQPDQSLKTQSLSESTSTKQYKPPLLTLPSPHQPPGGYQPPLPLLPSVPRTPEVPRPSAPLERKPLLADTTELSQSPPERPSGVIDNRSKAIGSSHHPSQAIHQVPASEIQSDKSASAKDRDSAKNDEYVVYYYYYYDNDTNSNNLTLNFDDIPSLDSYDDTKSSKEPEKSASSRSIAANVNSLTPSTQDQPKDTAASPKPSSPSGASQARSISSADVGSESVIRADKPDNTLEDTVVEPLKPVSNVFRYGSNEVPRFPVLPNFIVSEVPKGEKTEEQLTPDTLSTPPSTTLPASTASGILNEERLQPEVDSDDANNVLDSDSKVVEEHEEKVTPESSPTTTTKTTTEPPTTTEITTTTTEKSRRRPGALGAGGRRRFSASSAPPATRGRQTPTRSTASISATSSTTTTTTTSAPSSPRTTFRGSSNRLRSRQPLGGNRPRTVPGSTSSKPEENDDTGSSKAVESTSTTASRSRSTPAPRRFAGGRNSASRSASTTSTVAPPKPRTTSRPRPNLITRNRPRPGFLKPKKEEEPEPVETTTPEAEVTEEKGSNSPNPAEETEADDKEESESPDTETPEAEEETEEPTTTEKNRFAALFRPRNRSSGNRPRPVIANRPSRSRR